MWVETQISHYGYWTGMVTLRRFEKPKNKVRFFEYPLYTPVVELEYTLTSKVRA